MAEEQCFISYGQNAEDVVLWRALGHVTAGRYVEVGANAPLESSITRAFYERGWSGVEIEPVRPFAEAFRADRPRDTVVQVAVTDSAAGSVTMHVIDGTGLSTLDDDIAERHRQDGWTTHDEIVPAARLDTVLAQHLTTDEPIHFMVVDVEGAEAPVLRSVDLRRWRPWVLVVEATAPNSPKLTHEAWEPLVLQAGYVFCLFDGLSRFYVAEEREPELGPALSAPSSPHDHFIPHAVQRLEAELGQARQERGSWDQERQSWEREKAAACAEAAGMRETQAHLTEELIRWRGAVLSRWSQAAAGGGGGAPGPEVARLRQEIVATHATVSWRVTAPLRAVQTRRLRGWR